MTDNEIIKALECCIKPNCGECPIFYNSEIRKVPGRCVVTLEKDALDLINLQKAEIERLTEEKEELRASIEMFTEIGKMYSEIKAEAYKEIAESVKIKTLAMVRSPGILTTADYIKCIDDIVKEWVGENND